MMRRKERKAMRKGLVINKSCILARAPGGQMRGATTQAMRGHRRGAATKQMPARRRAPSDCGPQALWLRCSLPPCNPAWPGLRTQFSSLAPSQGVWGPAAKCSLYLLPGPKLILLTILSMSIFLCGCPKPTQYARPNLPVPQNWPGNTAGPAGGDAVTPSETDWKEFFLNEQLQSVIQLALENNRDLRMAAFNIEKAQAMYRIQHAELYPKVTASANGEYYRLPADMAGADEAEIVAQHTVGLGIASWELDFFGRIKSLKSAALEQYFATGQARAATQISLVGSVAGAYLALAGDREILRLAEATVNTQQAYYELICQTRDIGIASDLEVSQARIQVEAARVDIARYSGYIAEDENALNLLVGAPVPAGLLPKGLDALPGMKEIAAGVSSEVLLRRPDILMAEHQLKAYNANIGAARANYFPRISLTTGALGFISTDLADLFKYSSRTWAFAPSIVLPLFDSGTRDASYKAAQADRDIAVAMYEKSIQSAFREVSDALSLRTTLVDQQNAQESLVKALEETYRLSEARYKGGIDSYLSVLVAQRALYVAQQELVGTQLARLSNQVVLYKVLGGGA